MTELWHFGLALIGMGLGSLITWLSMRASRSALQVHLAAIQQDLANARTELATQVRNNSELSARIAGLEATIDHERKASEDRISLLNQAKDELQKAFQALSAEALRNNNQTFLDLAKTSLERFQSEAKGDLELRQRAIETLLAPIVDSIDKVDAQIAKIEESRNQAYGSLTTQVQSLIKTQEKLQAETGNLARALRTPHVRGRWGEIQLRRVVEIAGMVSYCDFVEQETVTTTEGRLRPDLIIKLPAGKNIVVDAKTPLIAYLDAVETTNDEVRKQKLIEHAAQVRAHISQLSSKAYWEQFEASPEFVVMFLPGETFFSAALEQDATLIEYGAGLRVIPASPTTLIALLKAIAYGWNQEKLARNAQEISALGRELHERLRLLGSHIDAVGKGLDRAVDAYNKAVGSLESRVMVSARKFVELGGPVTAEIAELSPIETTTRNLTLQFDDPDAAQATILTPEPTAQATLKSKEASANK